MRLLSCMAVLTLAVALAGCSSTIVKSGIGRLGGPGTTAAVKPAEGAESIWVTLPAKGIKFPMSELANADGVTVFAAKDGSQLALRDGLVVNSRGFGRDLMSASVPGPRQLAAMGEHNRVYYDLDGTDTMRRHDFKCTSEAGAVEGTNFARHIVEKCVAEIGTIQNEFWLNGAGRVEKSQQWVSQGVGYAAVEPKLE